MTMVQQVLQALGIDGDAAKRLSKAGRRAQRTAQQTGARWGRLARRRIPDMPDIRSLAGGRRSTPQVMNGIPPAYFWIGAGIVGAAVLAAMMRPRIPGASGGRRVGDVMVKNVVTIDASATIQEAAQRMRESNIGVLPVVDGGRLRGVITDRDLVIRGVARGMDAAHTPIRYIATEDLACARADWDVDAAMQAMSDCQVGRLPVVDDAHRVVGIVTLSSLALRAREDRETLHTAAEVSRRSARSA
ncbi:MAG: CBS domain-containing protein [Candidatus Rokubacteria bacterium]|nr:CBS domain-containing protein [Candidatus Rokubacteria bacterium]